MGKMRPNAKKREYRRHDLLVYLLAVSSTSYKSLREHLDVTDKTIRDDLAYLQDIEGIILECKAGVGGYVRVSEEWRRRKCPFTPAEAEAILVAYQGATDPDLKNTYLGLLIKYCPPFSYENKL